MGQGGRIESLTHCPLTPRLKRSLNPQGIKKSLNLRFRPNPILVTVSLALILMASGPVIFWMLIPVELIQEFSGGMYGEELWILAPYWFACFMWFGVITLLAGLNVRKSRPNSLYPPIVVDVSLLLILIASGLVIGYMLVVLLQIPVYSVQQAGAVAFLWILSILPPGLILIAERMGKRVSMVE